MGVRPVFQEGACQYLEAWDGRAETNSLGLPLLVEFRAELMKAFLDPLLAGCREIEPLFSYHWHGADVPVQRIIDSGRVELLPDSQEFRDWNSFLRAVLVQSARQLAERQGVKTLSDMRWGNVSKVEIRHPLATASPFLSFMLDMPREPLAGCRHCVRLAEGNHVAPGHESDEILHMPGGQSGQPGSRHYADQQQAWVAGWPTNFSGGAAVHQLILKPQTSGAEAR